jgi:hypothetical protein
VSVPEVWRGGGTVRIHDDGTHEWHHKDGRRQYWAVLAWPTGEKAEAWEGAGELYMDEAWDYRIDLEGQQAGTGSIVVQAGMPHPDPHDIFNDWIGSLLSVACGFAQSREEWYGTGEELAK